ncbi:MAG: hypothetical protein QGH40_11415 [bacterium]|jgi:hypothetical protein|nr:hypothetical protein [bacterium]
MKHGRSAGIVAVVIMAALAAGLSHAEVLDLSLSGEIQIKSGEYVYELAAGESTGSVSGPVLKVIEQISGNPLVTFRDFKPGDELLLNSRKITVLDRNDATVSIEIEDHNWDVYSGYGQYFKLSVDDIISIGNGYYVEVLSVNYEPADGRHSMDIKVSPAGRPFQISLKPDLPVNIGPALLELEEVYSFTRAVLDVRRPPEPGPAADGGSLVVPEPGDVSPGSRLRGFVEVLTPVGNKRDLLSTVIKFKIASGDNRAQYLMELAEVVGFEVKGLTFITGEETVSISMDKSTAGEAVSILLRKGWDFTFDGAAATLIAVPRSRTTSSGFSE